MPPHTYVHYFLSIDIYLKTGNLEYYYSVVIAELLYLHFSTPQPTLTNQLTLYTL